MINSVGNVAAMLPMVPGAMQVAQGAPIVAELLRNFGIGRVSQEAMAALNNGNKGKGRGGRRRRLRSAVRRSNANGGGGGSPSGSNRAESTPSAPVRIATARPALYTTSGAIPNNRDGVRLSGCEPVAVASGTTVAGGFVIFLSTILTPANSTLHPWLAAQAPYWTKFMYRKVALHVVPVTGTDQPGLSWTAFTPDTEIDNPTTLQQAQTMAQQKESQVWNQFRHPLDIKQEGVEPFYIDTDGADDRLEVQGNIFAGAALTGAAVDAVQAPKFQLFIEYTVDLYDRKLNTLTELTGDLLRALKCPRLTDAERRAAGLAFVEAVLLEVRPKAEKKTLGSRRVEVLRRLALQQGRPNDPRFQVTAHSSQMAGL